MSQWKYRLRRLTIGFPESRADIITRLLIGLAVPWFLCLGTLLLLQGRNEEQLARHDSITREFTERQPEIIVTLLAAVLAAPHEHSSPATHLPQLKCTNGLDAELRTLLTNKLAPSAFQKGNLRKAAELLEKFSENSDYMVDQIDCDLLRTVLRDSAASANSNSFERAFMSATPDSAESRSLRAHLESRLMSPSTTNIVSLIKHRTLRKEERYRLAIGTVPLGVLTEKLLFSIVGIAIPALLFSAAWSLRTYKDGIAPLLLLGGGLVATFWIGSEIWKNARSISAVNPFGNLMLTGIATAYLLLAWGALALSSLIADRLQQRQPSGGHHVVHANDFSKNDENAFVTVGLIFGFFFFIELITIMALNGKPLLLSAIIHDLVIILNFRHLDDGYLQLVAIASVLFLFYGTAALTSYIYGMLQRIPDYRNLNAKGFDLAALFLASFTVSYLFITAVGGNINHRNTQELLVKPLQHDSAPDINPEAYTLGNTFYKRRYMSASTDRGFDNWKGRLSDRTLFFPGLWSSLMWSPQFSLKNLLLALFEALYCAPLIIQVTRFTRSRFVPPKASTGI